MYPNFLYMSSPPEDLSWATHSPGDCFMLQSSWTAVITGNDEAKTSCITASHKFISVVLTSVNSTIGIMHSWHFYWFKKGGYTQNQRLMPIDPSDPVWDTSWVTCMGSTQWHRNFIPEGKTKSWVWECYCAFNQVISKRVRARMVHWYSQVISSQKWEPPRLGAGGLDNFHLPAIQSEDV